MKCYNAKPKSVHVLGASQVRLHGKGSSGGELRAQPSAQERKLALSESAGVRMSSEPSLQHRRESWLPVKTLVCVFHSRVSGLNLIIAIGGQKDRKETHPKARILVMEALRQERYE